MRKILILRTAPAEPDSAFNLLGDALDSGADVELRAICLVGADIDYDAVVDAVFWADSVWVE